MAAQALPRFSPLSRYRQTAPVAMKVKLLVKPATTVMFTGAEVRTIPLSSVATARKANAPAGTLVQEKANGLDVSSPSFVALAKNSTLKMAPSGSRALAARSMLDVATKTAFVTGLVSVTVGGRLEPVGG